MSKPVLVSGIQPTGKLHIGNYLGALKNFVELQNSGKFKCFFFVVDLHSLTEDYVAANKPNQVLEIAADFLAAGIEPDKSVLALQSLVPAHSELAWLFNTITPMGEAERMTQFKDKSQNQNENINVGLFTYPILMAADIVLYNAAVVPVGDDQNQHLELTRTLARKFNKRFGETFLEPKALMTQTPRVMSLKDPLKKMSKSDPASCLFLDDEPETVREKIKRAVTDSGTTIFYDPVQKPALSNLLRIWSSLTGESLDNSEERFAGVSYAQFKEELAETVIKHFTPFREKKAKLMAKPGVLKKILRQGSEEASKVADKKLEEARKKMGIVL